MCIKWSLTLCDCMYFSQVYHATGSWISKPPWWSAKLVSPLCTVLLLPCIRSWPLECCGLYKSLGVRGQSLIMSPLEVFATGIKTRSSKKNVLHLLIYSASNASWLTSKGFAKWKPHLLSVLRIVGPFSLKHFIALRVSYYLLWGRG